jgi:hypothetical protein
MKNESGNFGHATYSMQLPRGPGLRWELKKAGRKVAGKVSKWNYEVVDLDRGCVVARYFNDGGEDLLLSGRLQVVGELTEDEELFVLLGALRMCETLRRRKASGGAIPWMVGAGVVY